MPKGNVQGGAAGDQDPRIPGAYGGLGASGGAQGDDDEPEDFVLSEENLSKLDPTMRAVAAAALRSQREAAEAKAKLAEVLAGQREDDPDDDPDDPDEFDENEFNQAITARVQKILEQIPEDGYEKLTPALRNILGAMIRDNATLRLELERTRTREEVQRPKRAFGDFQRYNKGWEKHDGTMGRLVKALGYEPKTVEQYEALLGIAQAVDSGSELQAEVKALRKAGAVPSLKAPVVSSVRRIMAEGRKKSSGNGRRRSMDEIFAEGLSRAEAELGQG